MGSNQQYAYFREVGLAIEKKDGGQLSKFLSASLIKELIKQDEGRGNQWDTQGGHQLPSPWGPPLAFLVVALAKQLQSPPQLPAATSEALKAAEELFSWLQKSEADPTWLVGSMARYISLLVDLAFWSDEYSRSVLKISSKVGDLTKIIRRSFNALRDAGSGGKRLLCLPEVIALIRIVFREANDTTFQHDVCRTLVEQFSPVADAVGDRAPPALFGEYNFLRGRLEVLRGNYKEASQCLERCITLLRQARGGRQEVVGQLNPTEIFMHVGLVRVLVGGALSRQELQDFNCLELEPLAKAADMGDLRLYQWTTMAFHTLFRQLSLQAVYRIELLVMRTLWKHLVEGLPLNAKGVYVVKVEDFRGLVNEQGFDVDYDYAEAVVMRLLGCNLMRGNYVHGQQQLIIPATTPFPKLIDATWI